MLYMYVAELISPVCAQLASLSMCAVSKGSLYRVVLSMVSSRPLQKSTLQLWDIGCFNAALVCFPYNLHVCVEFVECVGYPLGIADD